MALVKIAVIITSSIVVLLERVSDPKRLRWADMTLADFDKHFGAAAVKVPPTPALINRFLQLSK